MDGNIKPLELIEEYDRGRDLAKLMDEEVFLLTSKQVKIKKARNQHWGIKFNRCASDFKCAL